MIHSYQIPNQWTWKIFLCFADAHESLKEISQFYNENENMHINEDFDGECPCCIYDRKNLIAIVCINEWKFDIQHIGDLSHEVIHMIICISEECGCPINIHTTECWAYAYDTFIETFLEILNTNHLDKGETNVRSNIRQESCKRHTK